MWGVLAAFVSACGPATAPPLAASSGGVMRFVQVIIGGAQEVTLLDPHGRQVVISGDSVQVSQVAGANVEFNSVDAVDEDEPGQAQASIQLTHIVPGAWEIRARCKPESMVSVEIHAERGDGGECHAGDVIEPAPGALQRWRFSFGSSPNGDSCAVRLVRVLPPKPKHSSVRTHGS